MKKLPIGPTNRGSKDQFSGDVFVNLVYAGEDPSRMVVANVRFTPGAHTNWHRHVLGQTLHCTDGIGLVVTRDGSVQVLRPGDTVWTPPGEDHWHGAIDSNLMAHLALLEGTGQGDPTTWLEPVDEADYARALTEAKDQQ